MLLKLISVDHLPDGGVQLPNRLGPFLWYFIRQGKWQFLFMALVFAIGQALDTSPYLFIGIILDSLNEIQDKGQIWTVLFWPLFWFVLLALILQPMCARYGQYLMANVRPVFTNLMRRQLAIHMHRHSYKYFQDDFAGRLASKVVETPSAIMTVIQEVLTSIGFAIVSLIFAMVLFSMTYWMFLVATIVWAFLYIVLMIIYVPKVHARSVESYDQSSIVRGRFVDTLTNILTVKLFARRKYEDAYLLKSLEKTADAGQRLMHTFNSMWIWLEVVSIGFIGSTFFIAIYGWQTGGISAGDVAMVLPLCIRLMTISWWMSNVLGMVFENLGQVQEGMETLTKAHTVTDKEDAAAIKVEAGTIEFKHVNFSYMKGHDEA
ncbi:MAG: ABC transporter ATP-binding protein [Rhodospirillales bacterium]|nr:ABC transporter ATP-binding protein [Rhodospirillales bacterium]